MPEIFINGQPVQAEANQTVLQAALANGFYIPYFCWHKELSIAGNCRICTVQVEGRSWVEISCNMLLDVRDPSFTHRFSRWLFPGMAFGTLLFAALGYGLVLGVDRLATTSPSFGLAQFAAAFLSEYWLQFELTSVLLVAAVVAALAVIKGSRRRDRG